MPEHCTCGVQLPPDARFCHKCGKPQFDYPEPEPEPVSEPVAAAVAKRPDDTGISFHNRTAVRVSFLAALVAFLLTAIPLPPLITVIRLLVCFVAAGFLAVYVYKRRTGQTVTVRAGARLGWMTGIFSFTILTVLLAGGMLLLSTFRQDFMGKDPNVDRLIHMMDDQGTMVSALLSGLLVLFVLYTLLPMLGGALCAKVLEKD
ncbi:MAG: zinc ribbon domain-containing protein [Bryobacteraceae bacterium]